MTFVEDVNQFGMIVGILCYATPQAYNYYQEKCFYINNNTILRDNLFLFSVQMMSLHIQPLTILPFYPLI